MVRWEEVYAGTVHITFVGGGPGGGRLLDTHPQEVATSSDA